MEQVLYDPLDTYQGQIGGKVGLLAGEAEGFLFLHSDRTMAHHALEELEANNQLPSVNLIARLDMLREHGSWSAKWYLGHMALFYRRNCGIINRSDTQVAHYLDTYEPEIDELHEQ